MRLMLCEFGPDFEARVIIEVVASWGDFVRARGARTGIFLHGG